MAAGSGDGNAVELQIAEALNYRERGLPGSLPAPGGAARQSALLELEQPAADEGESAGLAAVEAGAGGGRAQGSRAVEILARVVRAMAPKSSSLVGGVLLDRALLSDGLTPSADPSV